MITMGYRDNIVLIFTEVRFLEEVDIILCETHEKLGGGQFECEVATNVPASNGYIAGRYIGKTSTRYRIRGVITSILETILPQKFFLTSTDTKSSGQFCAHAATKLLASRADLKEART